MITLICYRGKHALQGIGRSVYRRKSLTLALPDDTKSEFNVPLRPQMPVRTIRDGEPRKATSTFTQLLNSDMIVQVQCCFTSTETIRAISSIRDGEPRKATSTFTQLLSSASKRGLNNLYLNYKPAFPLNPCRRFC